MPACSQDPVTLPAPSSHTIHSISLAYHRSPLPGLHASQFVVLPSFSCSLFLGNTGPIHRDSRVSFHCLSHDDTSTECHPFWLHPSLSVSGSTGPSKAAVEVPKQHGAGAHRKFWKLAQDWTPPLVPIFNCRNVFRDTEHTGKQTSDRQAVL